ncbi:hypothetical protein IH779_00545 [Patescibacteria group bacterium]|nr:hypothetical protein [Patescibacteria group bacterium]
MKYKVRRNEEKKFSELQTSCFRLGSPRVADFRIQKGVSVIEILVVIFILAVAFVGILGLITFSLKVSTLTKETTQAVNITQETFEVVRNFRDGKDWSTDGLGSLVMEVPYHPEKTIDIPPQWALIQGEEIIDGFSRKVVFKEVFRDGNDDIVETGGVLDPDTKKATVTVSWKDQEVEVATYFTNWNQ